MDTVLRDTALLEAIASMTDGVIVMATDGTIITANPALQSLLQMDCSEFVGQQAAALADRCVSPDLLPEVKISLANLLSGNMESFKPKVRDLNTANGRISILGSASPLRTPTGETTAYMVVIKDVTELHKTRLELERTRDMFVRAQRMTKCGSWEWDIPAETVWWSDGMYRLFGYEPSEVELTYELIMEHVHPRDREGVEMIVKEGIQKREPFRATHRIITWDGAEKQLVMEGDMITGDDGKPQLVFGSTMDITERRELEQEMLDIVIREQRRMAHDLHDTLGQTLAATGLMADALQDTLQADSHGSYTHAAAIGDLVREAMSTSRNVAQGLCPVEIGAEGLSEALRTMCRKVTDVFGIDCRYESTPAAPVYDSTVAMHLYCIAREAIHNAIRHGSSTHVGVALHVDPDWQCLTVQDNGKGLPPQLDMSRGLGIRAMRYRSELIHGGLLFRRPEAGGTHLSCFFHNTRPAASPQSARNARALND